MLEGVMASLYIELRDAKHPLLNRVGGWGIAKINFLRKK